MQEKYLKIIEKKLLTGISICDIIINVPQESGTRKGNKKGH